nr:endonuclease/exonuclease/phosphatase family protein [Acidimicrobiia bacterium]
LERLDADVAGLQEAYRCQERYLGRQLPEHSSVSRGRDANDRGERCPVLYRTARFQLDGAVVRWFSDEPDVPGSRLPNASFPRIATLVELTDRASGRRFGVANTHLDERQRPNRVRSAELLASWLRPGIPWVVTGDLNAEPDAKPLRVLQAHGLQSVLPDDAGGTNHDFTGRTDGRRIDHILVSDEWEVAAAEVDHHRPNGRLPSDHWPIVADLRLREA